MSSNEAKAVQPIKDKITVILNRFLLTEMKPGESHSTPKIKVPLSDGLQWWIVFYPNGEDASDKAHLSIYLAVNKPAKPKFSFAIDGTSIQFAQNATSSSTCWGHRKYASHSQLRPLFRGGVLNIRCSVEFQVGVPLSFLKARLFESCSHVDTDLELVMESGSVKVHKSLLSLISPVFHAMFLHDTVELKSKKVEITDFDFDVVKAAIDFCYDRAELLSVELIVGMLRFGDKYDIKTITVQLETILPCNLTIATFCLIVQYAYDCSRPGLLSECSKFFKRHQLQITAMGTFAALPPQLVVNVLKGAFHLKTTLDVLHFAINDVGLRFVVNHLESPIFQSLSSDNFCRVVNYAWQCSRDELKQACAKFLNDNRVAVTKLDSFTKLSPEVMCDLFKLANNS
uniref:BTB domain-containing protein n=1 Tax=Panagrellus redivivus TaxID=6233 RepID=A0A7E4ZS36_PANRE